MFITLVQGHVNMLFGFFLKSVNPAISLRLPEQQLRTLQVCFVSRLRRKNLKCLFQFPFHPNLISVLWGSNTVKCLGRSAWQSHTLTSGPLVVYLNTALVSSSQPESHVSHFLSALPRQRFNSSSQCFALASSPYRIYARMPLRP